MSCFRAVDSCLICVVLLVDDINAGLFVCLCVDSLLFVVVVRRCCSSLLWSCCWFVVALLCRSSALPRSIVTCSTFFVSTCNVQRSPRRCSTVVVRCSSLLLHRGSFVVLLLHRSSLLLDRRSIVVAPASDTIHRSLCARCSCIVRGCSFAVHCCWSIVRRPSSLRHSRFFVVAPSSLIVHRCCFIVGPASSSCVRHRPQSIVVRALLVLVRSLFVDVRSPVAVRCLSLEQQLPIG